MRATESNPRIRYQPTHRILRELDVQIAKHVTKIGVHRYGSTDDYYGDDGNWIPHYSTNISAAFQIVEKLKDDVGEFSLQQDQGELDEWIAQFDPYGEKPNERDFHPDAFARAHTIPLAICYAALKVMKKGNL